MKIFPGIIVRQHHTDRKQMGLLRRAVRRVKEGTSAVLLQSRLDPKWWADSFEFQCGTPAYYVFITRLKARSVWQNSSSAKHGVDLESHGGCAVLRGDIVKDDSGSYAVFTEQGSSASQTTAAKVMDIISRLSGCAGQAADAVSAYAQVKMEDAPKLLKIPRSECPDIWIRLPRHKWPKSWSSMEDPVVPLERNLHGHPLAGLLWERQFEKILLEYGWEKVSNWECFFVHREKGLF